MPRILPLVGVAIGGVLAINALAGARDLPDLFSGAKAFAEEAAGKAAEGDKGKDAKARSRQPTAAARRREDAASACRRRRCRRRPSSRRPVCAPTAAELAKEAGLSPAELQVLQNLGARRGQLDQRENDLDTQLALLAAAEAKLDAKVKALTGLKADVQGLLHPGRRTRGRRGRPAGEGVRGHEAQGRRAADDAARRHRAPADRRQDEGALALGDHRPDAAGGRQEADRGAGPALRRRPVAGRQTRASPRPTPSTPAPPPRPPRGRPPAKAKAAPAQGRPKKPPPRKSAAAPQAQAAAAPRRPRPRRPAPAAARARGAEGRLTDEPAPGPALRRRGGRDRRRRRARRRWRRRRTPRPGRSTCTWPRPHNFSRIEFHWRGGAEDPAASGQTLTFRFGRDADPDIARLRTDPPRWIKTRREAPRRRPPASWCSRWPTTPTPRSGAADGAAFVNVFAKPPPDPAAAAEGAERRQAAVARAAPAQSGPGRRRRPHGGQGRQRPGAAQLRLGQSGRARRCSAAATRSGWCSTPRPTLDVAKAPRGVQPVQRHPGRSAAPTTPPSASRRRTTCRCSPRARAGPGPSRSGPATRAQPSLVRVAARRRAAARAALKAPVAGATRIVQAGRSRRSATR